LGKPPEEGAGEVGPISVVLEETPFMDLLELASECRVPSDPDYEQHLQDRVGLAAAGGGTGGGASGGSTWGAKTRADAVVQTADVWVRTKWTQKHRKQKRNQHTMVTTWEIWDMEVSDPLLQ